MNRLEALAEAIAHHTGYDNPESALYQARNPLGLKGFLPDHKCDAGNHRLFRNIQQGWACAIFDLQIKCSGKAHNRKLKPSATLLDLMVSYGWQESMADYVARFLRRALKDESVSRKTTLAYFLIKE